MSSTSNVESINIKSIESELSKWHYVYDGLGRLIETYETLSSAINGAKCILTKYTYDGVTNRVQNQREFSSIWDSSWDIAP